MLTGPVFLPVAQADASLRLGGNLPGDIRECSLTIALENAKSRVWVDDVQVEAKPAASFFTNGTRPGLECP